MNTVKEMQKIETEAKELLESFEIKTRGLKTEFDNQLKLESDKMDSETVTILDGMTRSFNVKNEGLENELSVKINANKLKIESQFSQEKDRLLNQIIDKVVSVYGN